jgi:hypothetical protein
MLGLDCPFSTSTPQVQDIPVPLRRELEEEESRPRFHEEVSEY